MKGKIIFFSILGHLAAFGLFSFSFGNKVPLQQFSPVSFWGRCLYNSQVVPSQAKLAGPLQAASRVTAFIPSRSAADSTMQLSDRHYIKPVILLSLEEEKKTYIACRQWRQIFPFLFLPNAHRGEYAW